MSASAAAAQARTRRRVPEPRRRDVSTSPVSRAGDLVAEIVKELKVRMKARGDTGQIKRAEQLLGEIQMGRRRRRIRTPS